jgi:hypothetical protein
LSETQGPNSFRIGNAKDGAVATASSQHEYLFVANEHKHKLNEYLFVANEKKALTSFWHDVMLANFKRCWGLVSFSPLVSF